MPGLIATSSKSEWVFNLRDTSYYDTDPETETENSCPESTAAVQTVTAKIGATSHNKLLKELDLSSREDLANYVSNPWTIAKQNAACRPPSVAKSAAEVEQPNLLKNIESGSDPVHHTARSNCFPALSVDNKRRHQEHSKKLAQTTLVNAFTVEKDRFPKSTVSRITKPFSATFLDLADTNVMADVIVDKDSGKFRPDDSFVNFGVRVSPADYSPQPRLSISEAPDIESSPASSTWDELPPHIRSTVFASDIQSSSPVSSSIEAVDSNYKKHAPSYYMHSEVLSARSETNQKHLLHWQTGSISNIPPAQKDFSTSDSFPDYVTSKSCFHPAPRKMQDYFASSFYQQPCNDHVVSVNPVRPSVQKEINASLAPSSVHHLTETSMKSAVRPLTQRNSKLTRFSSLNLNVGPKRKTGDSDDDPDSTWSTLPSQVNKRSKASSHAKFTMKKAGKFRLPIAIQPISPATTVTIGTERLANGKRLTLYKPPSMEEQGSKPQPVILRVRKANLKILDLGLDTSEETGAFMEASACEKVYQNEIDVGPSFSTPCSSLLPRSSPSSPED